MIVLLAAENWNMLEQAIIFITRVEDYPLSVYFGTTMSDIPGAELALSVLYLCPMISIFILGVLLLRKKNEDRNNR